jgi:dynein heavy chain
LILKLLYEAKGDLLDDEVLIETLQKSKHDSIEIEEKLKKLEHDRQVFMNIRNFYRDVAIRVANLFFVILDLALIEPTYQWSLDFYVVLFIRGIKAGSAKSAKDTRVKSIINEFSIMLYESICRALLEKDKFIFSFLICIKVMEIEKKINSKDIRFLMVGGTWTDPK